MRFRRSRYYGGYGDVRFDAKSDANEAYRYCINDLKELLKSLPKVKEVAEKFLEHGNVAYDPGYAELTSRQFVEGTKFALQHLQECIKYAKKVNVNAKKLAR